MIEVKCQCGSDHEIPDDFVGEPAACPACGSIFRVIAAATADLTAGDQINARLKIRRGPRRVGEQLILRGLLPIEVGRSPIRALMLRGTRVSRTHCRFVRTATSWQVEDRNSSNGLFLNRARITTAELKNGDILGVGEYQLAYRLDRASVRPAQKNTPAPEDESAAISDPVFTAEGVHLCPACKSVVVPGALVCVQCGLGIAKTQTPPVSPFVPPVVSATVPSAALTPITFALPSGYLRPRVRRGRPR